MSYAIRVENLGKRYQLGETHAGSVREFVNRGWNRMLGRSEPAVQPVTLDPEAADRLEGNAFWALRDVCFEVKPGEVVGIIGRNGSGKSTLLKILSQITAPTTGRVELHGRVASLLEVGTGFHPELSGRENVYLNGAILGMTKLEIRRKFDEIVAFAEIEKFIDTPVKRYSSGMYVRLAFAVAAHLEPEILIIDEVLAVGDAEFQKKCLGKMGSLSRTEGRTVLFVSHNMSAVKALCKKCVLLDRGSLRITGSTHACLAAYLVKETAAKGEWKRDNFEARNALSIETVNAFLEGNQPRLSLQITITAKSNGSHKPAFVAVDILDSAGVSIMQALPTAEGFLVERNRRHYIRLSIELPPMIPGIYSTTTWVGSHNTETLDIVSNCCGFEVISSPDANRSFPHTPDHGYVVPISSYDYSTV